MLCPMDQRIGFRENLHRKPWILKTLGFFGTFSMFHFSMATPPPTWPAGTVPPHTSWACTPINSKELANKTREDWEYRTHQIINHESSRTIRTSHHIICFSLSPDWCAMFIYPMWYGIQNHILPQSLWKWICPTQELQGLGWTGYTS